ncbi:MAG: membrane protein insertion efficiency factor YidD [Acidimicrobiales bacterium]
MSRAMLWTIRQYQATSVVRQPRCRYLPTCSHYAAEAIERHGPVKGLWLALRRLSRCHPFGSFGFDPVPEA